MVRVISVAEKIVALTFVALVEEAQHVVLLGLVVVVVHVNAELHFLTTITFWCFWPRVFFPAGTRICSP